MRLAAPIRIVLDLALPPRCVGCGAVVREDHRFCGTCWQSLRFITPPWCAACNAPFAHDRGENAVCGRCLERRPLHSGVRAAVGYGPIARAVALRLKYGGRMALAETMARLMLRGLPDGEPLLVPVPLHRWRLWSRGYNQAGLIADAMARERRLQVEHFALQRRRRTPVLRGLNPRDRARAVAGAFVVPEAMRQGIAGRDVALVDDVYTSGTTAHACTRTLLTAGARSVTALCWARVLDEADD